MIAKKTRATKIKSKAAHVHDLVDYVCDADSAEPSPTRGHMVNAELAPREKVLFVQARGFISHHRKGWKAEMLALALEAPRSKNPFSHWILSWRQGELPTSAQFDEAVEMFLVELGLSGHQVVYAVHQDTQNVHLHMVINRVHPETSRVVKPNKGFDIEAGHRAIARIEAVQGWSSEINARYQLAEAGEINRSTVVEGQGRRPGQVARDIEVRTGERSAERIAIEDIAPLIVAARSWSELHSSIAAHGAEYRKKGSGAVLLIGDIAVKASSAGRACSLSAVERRIGLYVESAGISVTPRLPEPIDNTPGRGDYVIARRKHYDGKRAEEAATKLRHNNERAEAAARDKQEREEVYGRRDWTGRGTARNALAKVLAGRHAAARAELRDQQANDRARLRAQYQRWPDFATWLRGRIEAKHPRPAGMVIGRIVGAASTQVPRDIRGFLPIIRGEDVHYVGSDGVVAFADVGSEVLIYGKDRECILAALQLAAAKWGSFIVEGDERFLEQCVDLAVEYDFDIANPELRERIASAREQARNCVHSETANVEESIDDVIALIVRLYRALTMIDGAQPARDDWHAMREIVRLNLVRLDLPDPFEPLRALAPERLAAMYGEILERMPELLELEEPYVAEFLARLDAALDAADERRGDWKSLRFLAANDVAASDTKAVEALLLSDTEIRAVVIYEICARRAEIEEIERAQLDHGPNM